MWHSFLNNHKLNPASDPLLDASTHYVQVALHPSTIDYLVQCVGVSPIFLSTITRISWLLDTGNALFKTYRSDNHSDSNLSSIREFLLLNAPGLQPTAELLQKDFSAFQKEATLPMSGSNMTW